MAGTKTKVCNIKNIYIYIAYVFIGVYVGASNVLDGEKQAVVQRSLSVLSRRVGDDIARCIAPLLSVIVRLLLHQELDCPFLVLLCRHGVDPLLPIVRVASY